MPYKKKGKCVYKKDTGKKVGCTAGSVDDYLAALHANTNENIKEGGIMKISKSKLKKIIDEELERDALEEQTLQEYANADAIGAGYVPPVPGSLEQQGLDLGGIMNVEGGNMEAIYNNMQIVSRIMEQIPFHLIEDEYLKEELLDVTEGVREVLDEIAELDEKEEQLKQLDIEF